MNEETNPVPNEQTNDNANLEQQTSKVEVEKKATTPPTQVVKPHLEKSKAPYLKEFNKDDQYHY